MAPFFIGKRGTKSGTGIKSGLEQEIRAFFLKSHSMNKRVHMKFIHKHVSEKACVSKSAGSSFLHFRFISKLSNPEVLKLLLAFLLVVESGKKKKKKRLRDRSTRPSNFLPVSTLFPSGLVPVIDRFVRAAAAEKVGKY